MKDIYTSPLAKNWSQLLFCLEIMFEKHVWNFLVRLYCNKSWTANSWFFFCTTPSKTLNTSGQLWKMWRKNEQLTVFLEILFISILWLRLLSPKRYFDSFFDYFNKEMKMHFFFWYICICRHAESCKLYVILFVITFSYLYLFLTVFDSLKQLYECNQR